MKSPKFQYTLVELKSCINEASINAVWKDSVGGQLRQQIATDLCEFRDYRRRLGALSSEICAEVYSGEYRTQPTRHYLVEKSRGLCRQMTIGAPRDLLVLQCLSNRLYKELKASQPTSNAYFQPGKGKFNQNNALIKPDAYGSISSWRRFQEAIFEFSTEHEFIVVTDVANFYDFINFAHLRNIISSVCKVSESIVDFLIFVLDSLAWHPDFMPSTGIGLPQMDIDAPRVLANAMLFELDRVADDMSFGDYARFMDDIDVGVDTIAEAKNVVRDIDLTLQSRQLRLNAAKTKILRSSNGEAAAHFCIRENRILDFAARFLETGAPLANLSVRKTVEKLYARWRVNAKFENSLFLRGNGEKIFKYLLGLMRRVGVQVPPDDLVWLIQNVPALRQVCFNALTYVPNPINQASRLFELFRAGVFIDDATYLYMANFLIHARFTRNAKTTTTIRNAVQLFVAQSGYFKVYAAIVIASKFLEPASIMELVASTRSHWEQDLWLGRVVAGLTPLLATRKKLMRQFEALGRSSRNPEWDSVFDYHRQLRSEPKAVKDAMAYAKHANPSLAYGIYHPKALTILSIKQNKAASAQYKAALAAHPALVGDLYYRPHFR